MNDEDLSSLLSALSKQDVDRYRAERTRALAHEELRHALSARQRKLRAFEPLLVAAACVVYLTWAFLRTLSALS